MPREPRQRKLHNLIRIPLTYYQYRDTKEGKYKATPVDLNDDDQQQPNTQPAQSRPQQMAGPNVNYTDFNMPGPDYLYQRSKARIARKYDKLRRWNNRIQLKASGFQRTNAMGNLPSWKDQQGNTWAGSGKYHRRGARKYRRKYYRGRGFYDGFLGDVGGVAGRALGSAFGAGNIGAKLGTAGGKWLAKKTGFGAYEDNDLSAQIPIMGNLGAAEGTITLSKREYLGDIISPDNGLHKQFEFSLNPGDSRLFPWLATIARNFEQYKLISMIFTYQSHSGDTTTSTQIGEVLGCSMVNFDKKVPQTKSQILEQSLSRSVSATAAAASFGIECDNNITDQGWRYVRNSDVLPSSAKIDEYDSQRFFLYTNGVPGTNTNIGSLYVSYEVALNRPVIPRGVENALMGKLLSLDAKTTTGISGTNLFGGNIDMRLSRPIANNEPYLAYNPANPFDGTSIDGVYVVMPPGMGYRNMIITLTGFQLNANSPKGIWAYTTRGPDTSKITAKAINWLQDTTRGDNGNGYNQFQIFDMNYVAVGAVDATNHLHVTTMVTLENNSKESWGYYGISKIEEAIPPIIDIGTLGYRQIMFKTITDTEAKLMDETTNTF